MGLPKINIRFNEKANTAVKRSSKGVVGIVLLETTEKNPKEIKNELEAFESTYSESNIKLLKMILLGGAKKVVAITITDVENIVDALEKVFPYNVDYVVAPSLNKDQEVITYVKAKREVGSKIKAVVSKTAADDAGVINFTTDQIVTQEGTYTSSQYTSRIAGVLAGLSMTKSATYHVLDEVSGFQDVANQDTAINNGELILMNDGEKIKIARGVTSLTSDQDSILKKIKIVEAKDMIQQDIKKTFADYYVGQVSNDYDNKMVLIAAINLYLKGLVQEGILDASYNNKVDIDIAGQINYMATKGIDADDLEEKAIREFNTGSDVFLRGNIKFVDAMEDLELVMSI